MYFPLCNSRKVCPCHVLSWTVQHSQVLPDLKACNCPEPVLDKTQKNPKQKTTQLQVFCDFETSFIQDPHTETQQSHLKTLKLLYTNMQQETAELFQCLDHAWEPREVPAATQKQK